MPAPQGVQHLLWQPMARAHRGSGEHTPEAAPAQTPSCSSSGLPEGCTDLCWTQTSSSHRCKGFPTRLAARGRGYGEGSSACHCFIGQKCCLSPMLSARSSSVLWLSRVTGQGGSSRSHPAALLRAPTPAAAAPGKVGAADASRHQGTPGLLPRLHISLWSSQLLF